MKTLQEIGKARIDKLQQDRSAIRLVKSFYPLDSFGCARIDLALEIIETKIRIWRAVCH